MLSYLDNNQLIIMINDGDKLIIAKNIVYKINDYMKHPGGNCILKRVLTIDSNNPNRIIIDSCDRDYNFHSKNSRNIWNNMAIGTIKERTIWDYILFL
jgi:hypothetical protein